MTEENKKTKAGSTPVKVGMLESITNLIRGKKPQTLEETVERLKVQADTEEEKTRLVKEAVDAKKRIAKAQKERQDLMGTSIAKSRFSKMQLIIMGIGAVILIIILASVVKC